MRIDFKKSFLRDLKRTADKSVKDRLKETIVSAEQAEGIHQIGNLKKLKHGERYYRIRVGDYRAGLVVEGDSLTFVRFLHRKDIYGYFP